MITLTDYDPAWPARFGALRDEYAAAMELAGVPVIAIEHIGSTAVPGLAAKPVIDCDIVVRADHVETASEVLESLGFEPQGELGILQRWAFREPGRLPRTNTYVVVAGSLALRNHLAVRDTLRAVPALREAYDAAKRRAAADATDAGAYAVGKNAVVQQILRRAGLTDAERAAIDAHQALGTGRRQQT